MPAKAGLWALLAAFALAVLWHLLTPTERPGTASPQHHVFTLNLDDPRQIASRTLSVREGDTVELQAHSAELAVLHLHGYALTLHLPPGQPISLEFVADRIGRFVLERHGQERRIATLEVYPRP